MGETPNYKIDHRREPGLTRKEMHKMETPIAKSDIYDHMLKQVNKYKKQLKEKESLNKKLLNISQEIIEEFVENNGVITADKMIRLRNIILDKEESYEY